MEYWEGFYLGPVWSDSDFNDRRHPLLFTGISFLVFLLTVLSILFPEKTSGLFVLPVAANFTIGFILLLALPFLWMVYYRQHLAVKFLILALYGLEYLCLLVAFVQFLLGHADIQIPKLMQVAVDVFDKLMSFSGEVFNFLGSLGSTIASVAGGIVIGGVLAVLGILLLIFIPFIYISLFRLVQRLVDRLVYNKIYKRS